ncbi:phosphohydrolase [Putridiphycobacter roseus]|uniref:Phosphohydrolase n=1 Tax=Putridiphycobacter roseus TaxID=2219161 RepID=A0A2W1N3M8_9FLAO|nr:HD domain-containing protein [Putridiphycobacter roseus]PZE18180.1 phosphohydrolase [Putridiphycobacter roseus]
MEENTVINQVVEQIKAQFKDDSSGHDWFHIDRVRRTAKKIATIEQADVYVTELGALLHDIADHKFVENPDEAALTSTAQILSALNVPQKTIEAVQHIVLNCSFKGGVEANKMKSLEGKIVQDADKLDAIGAIGIARTFAFGGKFGAILFDPNIGPMDHKDLASYQKNRSHTINHFHEKLLKLKDLMHTKTAQKMALKRHQFMEDYLIEFHHEWNAEIN